jgi:hypothetical protein
MNAWLLTWEGTSPKITDNNRIIGIIGSRRSDSFVAELVEFLYSRNYSSAFDMAYIANRPKKKNFTAEKTQIINGAPHGERIICGHNPWIYARKVKNLKITQEDDIEIITWQEPDNYHWKNKQKMQVEVERPGSMRTLKRSREHSLSRELESLYA